MNKPCVFFDRDGIVNRSPGPGYVESVDGFFLIPAFVTSLKLSRARGYESVLITNQRGVGRGIMTQAALDEIHDHMEALLQEEGVNFTSIKFCTDTDDSSPRRKPNPGMILEAAEEFGLDLERSWMIGDNIKDVQAGKRAGCQTVLVNDAVSSPDADRTIADMEALPALLEQIL